MTNRRPGEARTLWAHEDADRLPAALDDLASPLLFGGSQVLVVRHAEALTGSHEELVLSALGWLRAPACLILVARGLDSRRRLLTAFERAGGAFAFPRVTDPGALAEWVKRLARERGHVIRGDAVALLLERTMLDLGALDSEVEKASLYAGAGADLHAASVEATAAIAQSAAVEELADRLGRRDRRGAHRALRGLLRAGEPPVRIVAFLAGSLRRSLHVAELAEQGLDQDAIAARLGMPGWLVRRIRGPRSAAALERALATLRELDLALKSSRPAAAVFEDAVARIAGGATAPRSP